MPAKTPSDIVDRAASVAKSILTHVSIITKFESFTMTASPSSPEELQRMVRADYDFWTPIIKESGFNPLAS